MTDKQIIIDGCDVSGCEFFETKAQVMQCHMGALTQCCKANNCYYKQLKAKEQECESLEKQNEILLGQLVINDGEDVTVQISQSQFEEYNQLKAENKELKVYKSITPLKVKMLVKALTEIKEKFDEECKLCKADYVNITDEICEVCKNSEILQKISEVLDG